MRPSETTPTAVGYKLPFGMVSETVRRDNAEVPEKCVELTKGSSEHVQISPIQSAQSSFHEVDGNLGSRLGHIYGYGVKRKTLDLFEEFTTKPTICLSDLPHPSKLRGRKKRNVNAEPKTSVCSLRHSNTNTDSRIISHLQQLKKKVACRSDGLQLDAHYDRKSCVSETLTFGDKIDVNTADEQHERSLAYQSGSEVTDDGLHGDSNLGYRISETAHKLLAPSRRTRLITTAKPPPLYSEEFWNSLHRANTDKPKYHPRCTETPHTSLMDERYSDENSPSCLSVMYPVKSPAEAQEAEMIFTDLAVFNSPTLSPTTWISASCKHPSSGQVLPKDTMDADTDALAEYEE